MLALSPFWAAGLPYGPWTAGGGGPELERPGKTWSPCCCSWAVPAFSRGRGGLDAPRVELWCGLETTR